MSENVWRSCQGKYADPYVFYLLLFKKIELSYKNRLIGIITGDRENTRTDGTADKVCQT